MIVSISENMRPAPWQREFVESDEPRLCFDGGGGSGKTWALVAAAIREASLENRSVALVAGCGDKFGGFTKHIESIFWKCGIERVKSPKGVRKAYEWTTGHGTIRVYTVESTMPKNEQFDLIGVDNADEFGVSELESIASHMKPGGKLRLTQDPTRRNAILGQRIEAVIAPNPFLVSP